MKRFVLSALGVVCAITQLSAATEKAVVDTSYPPAPIEPYEVLTAYALSLEEEAQFNATDGEISPFWLNWATDQRVMDHAEINCTYNGNYLGNEYSSTGFDGATDAIMWVRAVWGERGLYLYIKVRDDSFVDDEVHRCPEDKNGVVTCHTTAEASWYNDAMDIYIDKIPTQYLYQSPDQYFVDFNQNRLTQGMTQIQYQFGAIGTVPEKFSYNKVVYNSAAGVWQFTEDREFTFARAQMEADGLIAEIISGSDKGLGDTAQVMEWFLPWSQIGLNGGMNPPTGGLSRKIAFCAGYNDADLGADDADFIRWIRAADPFKRVAPPEGGVFKPTDGWGDIELTFQPVPVVMPLKSTKSRSLTLSRVDYFTPSGRLVASVPARRGAVPAQLQATVPAHGILLERQISTTGEMIAQKRLVHGR